MRGPLLSIPACLIRGGTSKGLFFSGPDLRSAFGSDLARRDTFLARAMGSPDDSGMQMDGLGGAITSSSKVVIVSPPSRPGFDLDWEFGQVGINDGVIDWTNSCGNLASGLLMYGRDILKMVPPTTQKARIWQLVSNREVIVEEGAGELVEISGVPGRLETPVEVTFIGDDPDSGSAPRLPLLPTGNTTDILRNCAGSPIATLAGAPNPTIIVAESSTPPDQDLDQWLASLREQGAKAMGIPMTSGVRVALLREPEHYLTSSGEEVKPGQADLYAKITAPGRRFHHAITGTGASALSLVSQIPGTLAHEFVQRARGPATIGGRVGTATIGHPGGLMIGRAKVEKVDGVWKSVSVGFVRTCRLLFKGEVFARMER